MNDETSVLVKAGVLFINDNKKQYNLYDSNLLLEWSGTIETKLTVAYFKHCSKKVVLAVVTQCQAAILLKTTIFATMAQLCSMLLLLLFLQPSMSLHLHAGVSSSAKHKPNGRGLLSYCRAN